MFLVFLDGRRYWCSARQDNPLPQQPPNIGIGLGHGLGHVHGHGLTVPGDGGEEDIGATADQLALQLANPHHHHIDHTTHLPDTGNMMADGGGLEAISEIRVVEDL